MKNIKMIVVLLLIVSLLYGCTMEKAQNLDTSNSGEMGETTPSEELSDEEKYPEVIECGALEGYLTPESLESNTPCQVRLTKERTGPSPEEYSYPLYLSVDTGTQVFKKMLVETTPWADIDELSLADVDGDGLQEILVHDNTGGVGGFGLWRVWVLELEGEEIRVLFENYNEFDTGFESRFLDGYQLEVSNYITGYRLVFDVKENHRRYYEESGEVPSDGIMTDPFFEFIAEDVDGDGISEIICKQYTSIFGHSDYTGTACSVLKFSKDWKTFVVVDAWYEPYIEE